jgi:hypothetical membrane protein
LALLGLGGVCVFFVGVFPIDRRSPEAPVAEFVHDALSMASIVFAIAAMLTLTRHLLRDSDGRAVAATSLLLSLAALAGLLTLVLAYDTHWRGAVQRLCIGAVLSWLLLMATLLQPLDARALLRWGPQRHSLG